MKDRTRPVNLDLATLRFPVTAIVSILHRISGVLMFLSLPLLVIAWAISLRSAEGFTQISAIMQSIPVKIMLWGVITAVLYHLLAGIRHLVMDFGIGETLAGGRFSAQLIFVLAVLLSLGTGAWIW